MARRTLSQNCLRFTRAYNSSQRLKHTLCSCTNDPNVIHDRNNQRFTVTLDLDGRLSSAVLQYSITHDRQVELISTAVPQAHRGQGVAAHLAKAALDFVVEENLKAKISCWYIRKYVEDNPHLGYKTYMEDE